MKWITTDNDTPYKNQLCLCRKPYSYKERFWYDYDYSICVYLDYEWFVLETETTCDLYTFTEWISMDDIEESMEG